MTSGPRRPSQYCVDMWLWYQNVPVRMSDRGQLPSAQDSGRPGLAVPGRGARTCLAGSVEVVEEGVARDDGALGDKRRAVRPGGRVLE